MNIPMIVCIYYTSSSGEALAKGVETPKLEFRHLLVLISMVLIFCHFRKNLMRLVGCIQKIPHVTVHEYPFRASVTVHLNRSIVHRVVLDK